MGDTEKGLKLLSVSLNQFLDLIRGQQVQGQYIRLLAPVDLPDDVCVVSARDDVMRNGFLVLLESSEWEPTNPHCELEVINCALGDQVLELAETGVTHET